jgi:uncharacterized protein YceH (UPF0502 family)
MAAMALTPEEARVLACLVEKEATVPDSYPLTLNALRLACNQTSNRNPIVSYDDRVVEAALLSLKSIGLVRFVHPSHGGRTIRYRHAAGERWHLEHNELAVLAVLVLRGPQTSGEIRARVERQTESAGSSVEEALDTLAARSPEAFAVHLERRPGEREARWAHLLTGEVDESMLAPPGPPAAGAPLPAPRQDDERYAALLAEVAGLRRRLDRLEELLGVEPAGGADGEPVGDAAFGAAGRSGVDTEP